MYDFKEVVARSIEKIESYASHGTELSEARVFPRVHRAQKMHSQFRSPACWNTFECDITD